MVKEWLMDYDTFKKGMAKYPEILARRKEKERQ